MKQTTYKCDRCCAPLGEDGAANVENTFTTQAKIAYKLRFLPRHMEKYTEPIVWDLCESCRESLDDWLEGKRCPVCEAKMDAEVEG